MRVLVVHAGNLYGGTERTLEAFAQARRFEVNLDPSFAFCFDGPVVDALRRSGLEPRLLGRARITRPDLLFRARRQLALVIRDLRPAMVITPAAWSHAIFAPVVRRAGVPLAFWVHDALSGLPWIEKAAARHQPDLLICNSQFCLTQARQLFPETPARVVYCPVMFAPPTRPRAGVRAAMQTSEETVVITNVARMEPLKGHLDLIDGLARLRTATPWECWIVGGAQRPREKAYQQQLEDHAARHGLASRVRFLGTRTDVTDLLTASDIYCHPNRGAETFGIAIVEALHAGLPVIASGEGGPQEIVTVDTGRLVPPGSPGRLAEALGAYIEAGRMRSGNKLQGRARALALCDPATRLRGPLRSVVRVDRRGRCLMPPVMAPALADMPVVGHGRRLRIAVISYGLPYPGHKRGGIEQVAHDLSNAWVDRGHRVTVFTYDPRPETARYETASLMGARFVHTWFGRRVTMGYLGNVFTVLPGYRDFDVVVSHGDSLLLPLLGVPTVRIMHGSAVEEARSATNPGRALLQYGVYAQELLTAWLSPGTVGVSENTRRSNRFITHVIPNGIDRRVFRPDPSVRSDQPSILFVGALAGRKRGTWLIELFKRVVRAALPGAELHMVTDAGPREPGVFYHTGVDAPQLVRLYQAAWVYASPSTYEGFGLPYVEALACGTPVLATPNPGSLEVLEDGKYGVIANDGQFGPMLCHLLEDGARRTELARVGLQRAAAFDVAQSAARYEALMETLTTRHA